MLQPPAPTLWGSIQACLYSILKAERVLHCIVSDRNFIHGTSKQKAWQINIREMVMSESFIFNLRKLLKILEPIDKLITMFQSDCTALSDVLKNFAVLRPTLSTLEGLHADEKEYLTKLAKYIFKFIYSDARGISYVLDPRYIGDRLPLNIREGIEVTIYNHYLDDNKSSAEKKAQIFQEYNAFRAWALQQQSMNSFKYVRLCKGKTTMPQFWGSYLQDWPLLAYLALKVFSVASSSAASERNFSTMGFVHSKLRNCLGRDTVEKVVYVKTNNLQFTVNANLDAYDSARDNEGDAEEDLAV
jgi:hAT family C-terminal dimerisation region